MGVCLFSVLEVLQNTLCKCFCSSDCWANQQKRFIWAKESKLFIQIRAAKYSTSIKKKNIQLQNIYLPLKTLHKNTNIWETEGVHFKRQCSCFPMNWRQCAAGQLARTGEKSSPQKALVQTAEMLSCETPRNAPWTDCSEPLARVSECFHLVFGWVCPHMLETAQTQGWMQGLLLWDPSIAHIIHSCGICLLTVTTTMHWNSEWLMYF